jgi:uncharacterized small protein (DUF1192 family)
MAISDEEVFGKPPKKPASHEIGEPLDALSVHELAERIELLQGEIARVEAMAASKEASKKAADAFFKPG